MLMMLMLTMALVELRRRLHMMWMWCSKAWATLPRISSLYYTTPASSRLITSLTKRVATTTLHPTPRSCNAAMVDTITDITRMHLFFLPLCSTGAILYLSVSFRNFQPIPPSSTDHRLLLIHVHDDADKKKSNPIVSLLPLIINHSSLSALHWLGNIAAAS